MTAIRLVAKACLLAVSLAGLLVAILLLVPDSNDYAKASVDKHARLAAPGSAKLVLVGGSNLAFGVDSAELERELKGFRVVNMGMNAYLGLRFMLSEVMEDLEKGDVVVLSFEHELLFQSDHVDLVEGSGTDLLAILKARPASVRYLSTWKQCREVLGACPAVAQIKARRMLRGALNRLRGAVKQPSLITRIECRDGFNRYGDLESHLRVKWLEGLPAGPNLSKRALNKAALHLIRAFRDQMVARGVRVLFAPPPTPESFYARHRDAIRDVYRRMRETIWGEDLIPVEDYVFPDDAFFDDISHLGREARSERTARLIRDLSLRLARSPRARRGRGR